METTEIQLCEHWWTSFGGVYNFRGLSAPFTRALQNTLFVSAQKQVQCCCINHSLSDLCFLTLCHRCCCHPGTACVIEMSFTFIRASVYIPTTQNIIRGTYKGSLYFCDIFCNHHSISFMITHHQSTFLSKCHTWSHWTFSIRENASFFLLHCQGSAIFWVIVIQHCCCSHLSFFLSSISINC